MALSERDRRALMLGGTALAVIAAYFLAIEPLWAWYGGLVRSHDLAAAQVTRAISNDRKAAYFAEQVAQCEENTGELSAAKPYSEQMSAVSEKLISAAQESGAELKGTSPAAAVAWADDPSLQRASILLEAEADWTNVFQFITAIYRIEGVLSVEQMDVTGDPKKGGKLALKLTLSVLVQAAQDGDRLWSRSK